MTGKVKITFKTKGSVVADTTPNPLPKTPPKAPQTTKFKKIGQKYPSPAKTESLAKFYLSLLKERPNSSMALKWCVEHGLLSPKKSEEAVLMLGVQKIKLN
jgi:hypothetical protein